MQWDFPVEKLGVVVDVRPGGNFAKEWEVFLDKLFAGGMVSMQPNNPMAILFQADRRGIMFEEFLAEIGMSKADCPALRELVHELVEVADLPA